MKKKINMQIAFTKHLILYYFPFIAELEQVQLWVIGKYSEARDQFELDLQSLAGKPSF